MLSVNLLSGGPSNAILQQMSEGRVMVKSRFCSGAMVFVVWVSVAAVQEKEE